MNTPDTTPTAGGPGATVLCVEDEPLSMALVGATLRAYPRIRLLEAVNGRDGVRLAQAHRPGLMLLDMQLPDIDGLEVVRSLSELIAERAIHVVLLTGEPFSIEVVKAMSLGAHEYWPKPLSQDRLASVLQRVFGNPHDPRPVSGARPL
ncbi:Response regulator [Rubrivivax sp. A210]|uniref:response regulator n=1 Tax=Rubrivivax sp. A210 TaxID=2772301 RepID=UPI00191909D5|nr:response regulator [Rubrivivax sp. A210]CAD5369084.1 Response regulator [Rubrivivax sp. A210]